jgi:hypothetical protein
MADIEKEAVYEVLSSTTAEEATKVSVAHAAERISDRQPGHCAMGVCGECRGVVVA